MSDKVLSTLDRLKIAFSNLENISPHKIRSPSYQPRRASIAMIIRIRPKSSSHEHDKLESSELSSNISSQSEDENNDNNSITDLEDFWKFEWVKNGEPEIFYIKRALREGDRWSGQMAFPGGKQDINDVDDLDTAERETFEEVGLDLGNHKLFMCVGALDDREITSTFGKILLMVLCPFESPPIEISGSEVASTHWIPLSIFFNSEITQKWDPESIDLSSRLAPKSWILQNIFKTLIGRMHFHCIGLPHVDVDGVTTRILRLWGLTLQMTSDLIDMMYRQTEEPPRRLDAKRPKFDYWDVNFFVWYFLRHNRGWREYFMAVQKSCIIATIIRTLFALLLIRKLPVIFMRRSTDSGENISYLRFPSEDLKNLPN
ncbi:15726_t:CDS:2 [Funneliformis geosporum]|uniref:19054_t:CDS:1 n=1 Tax=Funneliformis geosporum TaxID=1117311 RepID=A0A9W4SQ85_9GLOM|nr:19054_t:CDS:2 [Funneliformis geosporum]CAI2179825.1 15726_t:CDS:2 [Funneliformis geosporum]